MKAKGGVIRVFLVRHGNTFNPGETCLQVGLRTDLALTEGGRTQLCARGEKLKQDGVRPKTIFAGSLKRQKESASILMQLLAPAEPVVLEDALNEIDYGLWEGLSAEEIKSRWPKEYELWSTSAVWPDGVFAGSEEAHLSTVWNFARRLQEDFEAGDDVLVVSSGGTIRYFYSLLTNKWEELAREARMKELKVATGSCSLLHLKPNLRSASNEPTGEVEVVFWNKKPSPGRANPL
jgi:probable phosphoglycerate mutase